MRFSRIRLENWRNFGSIDVQLQNRAFIVGANASGKSNLLDVFRFLRHLVIPGGGFQEAVHSRGGVSIIRNLAARRRSDVVIDVEMTNDDRIWRYRIEFNQGQRDPAPTLSQEKIWDKGRIVLDRPDKLDGNDPARLSQTLLEQTFANREFRVVSDFFESISYSHVVPQLVRDTERYMGRQFDPYGSDFLEQIATTKKRTQDARLRYIQTALKIAIPQLIRLELHRDEKGIAHLRGKYQHWRPQGAWQYETEFSDGTLRLMGLLWALLDGQGPLLLEEPEISLHPGVVRHIPQMIHLIQRERKTAIRQIFLSTHSNDLLSDEGIAPDEVLLLSQTNEGTTIRRSVEIEEVMQELGAGFTIADTVLPRTEPPNVQQLLLFNQ